MLARSGIVRYGVYQVDIEVSFPIKFSHSRLLNLGITRDLEMLTSHADYYEDEEKKKEHQELVELFSKAKRNKAEDRYQGKYILEPKTRSYYLNAVFAFDSVENANAFCQTLHCVYEATVYVTINIIPELMDIRSLFLDEQSEHVRDMIDEYDKKDKDEVRYLNKLLFIFTAAQSCLAGHIFTERCFTIEGDLYMLLGFRFRSMKCANDYARMVKEYEWSK